MNVRIPSAFLLIFLTSSISLATDVPGGNLNVDTTWTRDGSPWHVLGDVTIPAGRTLTIEPGAEVVFGAGDLLGAGADTSRVELVIAGQLVAAGTAEQPITMHAPTAGVGGWYGVVLEATSSGNRLEHMALADTVIALSGAAPGSTTVSDLAIARTTTGVRWTAGGQANFTRVRVTDAATGFELGATAGGNAAYALSECAAEKGTGTGLVLHASATATVERSAFLEFLNGVVAEAGSSLTLRNSVIAGNRQEGVRLTQSTAVPFTLLNNTIDRNVASFDSTPSPGVGLHVTKVTSAAQFVVRNNLVTNHGTAGILVDGTTQPAIDTNDVWNNGADYTGATGGLGAFSSNPLYVAPLGEWQFVEQPFSLLNYGLNENRSWTIHQPGARAIRLRITSLDTENGYDALRIYNAAGTLLATYSGTFSGVTVTVPGDTLVAQFKSDASNNRRGFEVSGYEWQSVATNYRLQPSSPAIDAGNPLGAPTADADGTARPYDGDFAGGARVDVGAYEWHENLPPVAVAGADRVVVPGATVTLDGSLSHDPDGEVTAWEWSFNDGTTATGKQVTKTFANAGTFTATLTVTDDQGVDATDALSVEVADNLPPMADAGADRYVRPGEEIAFDGTASTDDDGVILLYAWDFGDGSPDGSGPTVTHAYQTAGVFEVALTVTDNRGSTATHRLYVVVRESGNLPPLADAGAPQTVGEGETVTLSGAASRDMDGILASFQWDFGDGTSGEGNSVEHTYEAAGYYVVSLTVTDDDGAADTALTFVRVTSAPNQPPRADAGGPYAGGPGDTLSFDAGLSSDPDGVLVSWAWSFGDGATASGAQVEHAFAEPGQYVVRLTVTDEGGATGTDARVVTIAAAVNQPPVAIAGGPYVAVEGETIALDGSGCTDRDGTVASWEWELGDGRTVEGSAPEASWDEPGAYLVRVTVTDDLGSESSDAAIVTVRPRANAAPIADAGGNRLLEVDEEATFVPGESSDPDGTLAAFAWDFGDGTTAAEATATHAWSEPGSYLVRLTVTDDGGLEGSDFVLVTVSSSAPPENAAPIADAGDDRTGNAGEALSLTAEASSDSDGALVAWLWDFGDGASGAGETVSHAWVAGGTYTVTLTVVDDKGERASDTLSVVLNGRPAADVGPVRAAQVGQQLAFDGSASQDAEGEVVTWTWDFGDGATAEGATARHAWSTEGVYEVALTVTDEGGATGRATTTVLVLPMPAPAADDGGCASATPAAPALLLAALLMLRRRRNAA